MEYVFTTIITIILYEVIHFLLCFVCMFTFLALCEKYDSLFSLSFFHLHHQPRITNHKIAFGDLVEAKQSLQALLAGLNIVFENRKKLVLLQRQRPPTTKGGWWSLPLFIKNDTHIYYAKISKK